MNKELISIVVPIYNVEKYLVKCIESLLKQTYTNLEIILVNDGSTDNSLSLCEEYRKKDNRIKIINKKNGGLSDARNKGIDVATGKYIAFVDSDDYIECDMIEVLYRDLKENNANISMCGFDKIYEDESLKDNKNEIIDYKFEVFDREKSIRELILDKKIHNYAWNKLYEKSLFNEIRYPFGKKMEDIGTTYLLFNKADIIVNNPVKKYNYTQRKNSIVNTTSDNKLYIDRFELVKERYIFLSNIYPKMIELDIDFLFKIIELYRLNLKEYIKLNSIHDLGLNVLKKNGIKIFRRCALKDKIKIVLFYLNPNALFTR